MDDFREPVQTIAPGAKFPTVEEAEEIARAFAR